MKVILLLLGGDATRAHATLHHAFPDASIELISRDALDAGGFRRRLSALRSLRPDMLAVSMESLAGQRGQNLLRVFGALAGAKRVAMLDARGEFKEETRRRIILKTPKRLVREAARSALAVVGSQRKLRSLEQAVKGIESACSRQPIGTTPEILFVRATPGAGTQTGGASTHINGFVTAALETGARVRMIANDRIAGLDEQRIALKIIPLQSVGLTRSSFDLHNNLVFTKGLIAEVTDKPPDLIYQRYSRFTWAGVEASMISKRPLFLEYNGSEVWVGKHWDEAGMFPLLERVERLNLNAAALIFVVSEVERRNLLNAGIPDKKIVVNPNGVDVQRFHPGVGGEQERAKLGLAPDVILVGFVGTFGPWHGVLELAQAISLLSQEARLRFLFVGDGKLREQTEGIIQKAGMSDRVIFTGSVEHERVPALLDACDILVSPHVPLVDGSDFFGSPTKLFEYMAMARPVIHRSPP